MLKVAIIGMGTISGIHKNAIDKSEYAELTAVCDTDSSKAVDGVNFYTDIDEMLDNENLDCVHICLPHYLHYSTILKCADKKINVFVEKPLTLNYEEAEKLFGLDKKEGVKIGVCFQNRYNNTVQKLRELIKDIPKDEFLGSKGIVTWKRDMSYYDEAPWRGKMELSGGGVMINQSIHTIDLLSYLGGDFESVYADIDNFTLPDIDVEDSVMANFDYKNSAANSVFFATIGYCANSNVELEFVFKDEIYKISDNKLYSCKNEPVLICEDQTLEGSKHYYGASHITAIESFYKSIINDTDDYVSMKEGAYSLKLIENIVKSSRNNCRAVIN
ncbi:MAG: hypothetical protein ATN35_01855 [Epulopiscium sp. Nele67-Bin004]|nr:MAG: hypothetical protein ATN35_01855 [Epulopiscium sp. Nele67-Bin004]